MTDAKDVTLSLFKISTLLIALTLSGCFVETGSPPEPEPEPVCGWTPEGTCPDDVNTFSYQNLKEALDSGDTCWVFTAACIVTPASPVSFENIPAACKQNQFATCVQVQP